MSHKLYWRWTEGLENYAAEQKKSLKSTILGEGRKPTEDLTVEKASLGKLALL